MKLKIDKGTTDYFGGNTGDDIESVGDWKGPPISMTQVPMPLSTAS